MGSSTAQDLGFVFPTQRYGVRTVGGSQSIGAGPADRWFWLVVMARIRLCTPAHPLDEHS